ISSLPAVVYDEAPRAVLSRSLTWSLRNCFAALATSGVNCSRTRWVKEPSYTLAVRYLIQSGDGLRNSSTIARLIAPTYFSSSAALMIDSRSKLSLVSFRSSGTSDTSTSLRSSTRNGLESIRFGASRSVEDWYCWPLVRAAVRAVGAAKERQGG